MGDDARLGAVVSLAQRMAAAHTLREVAHAAGAGALEALGGSFAAVLVWERAHGRLRVLANVGQLAEGKEPFPERETYPVHDFPEMSRLLHERWASGGEPDAWVETAPGVGGGAGGRAGARSGEPPGRRGWGSRVVAPIVVHGQAWGELYVARAGSEPVYGRQDADFAAVLAAIVASGIAQNERLEEVRRLAFTDPLTGLANRRAVDIGLDEGLERHRADGTVLSLVVCDVNGLKRVNDEHGHEAGDRLLQHFGALLSLCGARLPDSLAARLGGDEFCLLATGPPADDVIEVASELCRRALELELGQGIACGVASTGDPIGPVDSARRVFRLADAAQYRAKAAHARTPVVAGRAGGRDDPVVRLADEAVARRGVERRRFRGRPPS
ncbi:diguanylate cyclase [Streptomyces sp. AJS327]|uniref:GGDEF domain-containing protein n=1 Tax=Streptomyces sp. AJS327 TaxID=2545265 RepID=UPI0015E0266E|nr:diguanylate cyclase [Streptomyces sp. AJS327]MBA0054223.1 diguanylate cyclase [Streptomyces sp. AJS327]